MWIMKTNRTLNDEGELSDDNNKDNNTIVENKPNNDITTN